LQALLESLETVRYKMKECVKKYQPFEQYMENVLRTSEFNSIAEIFNRYETLIEAKKSLERSQNDSLHTLENTSVQLVFSISILIRF
jgi:hypothetical protein